jgi:NAD+ synthase (glutamine-hydrolysing)
MRIALAQFDFPVADISGNVSRIIDCSRMARDQMGAKLVVFPELSLCGYLAEDLFLRADFMRQCQDALERLVTQIQGIDAVVGHPLSVQGKMFNALSWIRNGQIIGQYFKQALPNYTVFDEKRYFTPGNQALVVELGDVRIAPIICEDLWEASPARLAVQAGAQLIVSINASPYGLTNRRNRLAVIQDRARQHQIPIAYVNVVGGQDELVFDGASMVANAQGQLLGPAASFEDGLIVLDFDPSSRNWTPVNWKPSTQSDTQIIYQALVRATRDYVSKNNFAGVLLGLSGGVDSALTLTIAVDALGKDRVSAYMLTSPHTSQLSVDLAREQAQRLGVAYHQLNIQACMEASAQTLAPVFSGLNVDTTEENIQSRIRGLLLMALSNKTGQMLLSTGNKSELAVGYATLYGDMCGGFAPLKDVYKTQVYALCQYRNQHDPVILPAIIARPPTAELKPNQLDQDSLPPYDVLDAILERFVEQDEGIEQMVSAGFERAVVERVVSLVLRSEFKRQQSAPGPRINHRAFGRDRRYPISSAWR